MTTTTQRKCINHFPLNEHNSLQNRRVRLKQKPLDSALRDGQDRYDNSLTQKKSPAVPLNRSFKAENQRKC